MEPEWAAWTRMHPAERWKASRALLRHYLKIGGSLDPDPDPQCPFWSRQECEAFARDAVVYDVPMLQHETYRHFAGEVFVLPMTFERQNYAFALPSDSPLRERINLILLREIGSPEWKDVLAGYLGESFEQ